MLQEAEMPTRRTRYLNTNVKEAWFVVREREMPLLSNAVVVIGSPFAEQVAVKEAP